MAPVARQTILIVDDDSAVRTFIGGVLRQQGFAILEAANGAEALAVLGSRAARVDLAILDLVMPKMGGLDLANRLGGSRNEPKILYISGEHSVAMDSLARSAPHQLLTKPFSAQQLLRRVREMLDSAARA
jgi:two-component system cell cycle sensor histidine kinase/response regulator CckA